MRVADALQLKASVQLASKQVAEAASTLEAAKAILSGHLPGSHNKLLGIDSRLREIVKIQAKGLMHP